MTWLTNILARTYDLWAYRHEPEYIRKLVDTYWFTLLLLSVGVTIGALLYGGAKLLEVRGEAEGGDTFSPSEGGGTLLDRAKLDSTLEGFSAREANYESLKKNPPKITDPSR